MLWIGLGVSALCSAAFVAEVYPTIKRWWMRPVWERRTNFPRVKTMVHVKEKRDVNRF
jgi:hypothetical protein